MTNDAPPRKAKCFAIKNVTADEATELPCYPWEATIPARPGLSPAASKDDFRIWCGRKDTDWCFYSFVEALTPGRRVSLDNPAKYRHGIVLDYDSKMPIAEVRAAVLRNGAAGLLPMAISNTFSGAIRMVWVFEEPLLLDIKTLGAAFMAHALKKIKAKALCGGLDAASEKEIQYFEIGSGWELVDGAAPIPVHTTNLWLSEAVLADKKMLSLNTEGGTKIPYERIAAEIEKRYPGRVSGEITEGLRVPLFWIPDGIDRIGAILGEYGAICFSDRAGRSLVTWQEMFGRAFVEEFEAERTGAACSDYWYDGKAYWAKEGDLWCRNLTEEMSRRLRTLYKLNGACGRKDTCSEVDKALIAVQQGKRVENVAPFIFNQQEIVQFNGQKYLNINKRSMMAAAPEGVDGDFPWLREFFDKVWDDEVCHGGIGQRDYFFAWLKRFWESGLAGRLLSGQVVFIVGHAGQGKTFLSNFILGSIAGGFGDASAYLLGGESFNKELAEVGVWAVDDGMATIDGGSRKTFSSKIKKVIANPTIVYRPMYCDGAEMPWQGRLVVTCNNDPESLSIIPTTDNSILDKLMLFKFGEWQPHFPPNPVIEAKVKAELPFFLRWLAAWVPPEAVTVGAKARYGVNSFHHVDILGHSRELSPHNHFREELDALRKDEAFIPKGENVWVGTAGDLLRAGRDFFATRNTSSVLIGMWLSQIHKEGSAPWLGRKGLRQGSVRWSIDKNNPNGEEADK